MAERTDQRTREHDAVDVDADSDVDLGSILAEDDTATGPEPDAGGGLRARLGQKVRGVFSVQTFAIALVLTVVLSFVAGTVIPLVPGSISGLFGVFLGGFTLGVGTDRRHYVEIGAATALTGAITALFGNLTLALLGAGVPLVALGAGTSALAGVLGHYFGRDLRSGLTREI